MVGQSSGASLAHPPQERGDLSEAKGSWGAEKALAGVSVSWPCWRAGAEPRPDGDDPTQTPSPCRAEDAAPRGLQRCTRVWDQVWDQSPGRRLLPDAYSGLCARSVSGQCVCPRPDPIKCYRSFTWWQRGPCGLGRPGDTGVGALITPPGWRPALPRRGGHRLGALQQGPRPPGPRLREQKRWVRAGEERRRLPSVWPGGSAVETPGTGVIGSPGSGRTHGVSLRGEVSKTQPGAQCCLSFPRLSRLSHSNS